MHHARKLKSSYFLEVVVKGIYLNFTYYGIFQELFNPTVTTALAKLLIFIVFLSLTLVIAITSAFWLFFCQEIGKFQNTAECLMSEFKLY